MKEYDLIVLGSGPAGEKAAVKAAYFGYSVAVVEKEKVLGGAGVNTGTIPSKTLKETAIYYSGDRDKGLYGVDKVLRHKATIEDFMFRKNLVTKKLAEEVRRNLDLHKVDIYFGKGCLEDAHTVHIQGVVEEKIKGKFILVATGSFPFHPDNIPFDQEKVFDSDSILSLKHFPASICILGAGVIGCEYATIFAKLGSEVFLINRTDQILPFIDKEITDALVETMKQSKVNVLFNTSVETVELPKENENLLKVPLETGQVLHVDAFLFAAGRQGNIVGMNLDKLGVQSDNRGNVKVNKDYCTDVSNIYAVGDVIGFPALASTGMDQGRVAVEHMFHTKDTKKLNEILPYGIYTVPELSMVGITEEEAKKDKVPYCTGTAYYKDMPRGLIMGVDSGLLKLIFHKENLAILGVHIIGDHATEIIHYGMYLIEHAVTLNDVINKVFNFPTLHDLYKYAAYDGLGNLSGHKVKG